MDYQAVNNLIIPRSPPIQKPGEFVVLARTLTSPPLKKNTFENQIISEKTKIN